LAVLPLVGRLRTSTNPTK